MGYPKNSNTAGRDCGGSEKGSVTRGTKQTPVSPSKTGINPKRAGSGK